VIPTIISQLINGPAVVRLGDLKTTRDFTHVEDTCRGLMAIASMDGGLEEVFHIGSNTEITVEDLSYRIAALAEVDARIVEDPSRGLSADILACGQPLQKPDPGAESNPARLVPLGRLRYGHTSIQKPPRTIEETKYRFKQLLTFSITVITSFSKMPLRMGSLLGILIALASAIYGIFIFSEYFISGLFLAGYASIVLSVLFDWWSAAYGTWIHFASIWEVSSMK